MSRSRIHDSDREEISLFIEKHWHSRRVMSRGHAYYPHEQDGFIERINEEIVGLLTFRMDDDGIEILTLNATHVGQGIGTSLMLAAIQASRDSNCERIWLTTTNDNLRGLGFYQRLGFRLIEINIDAVDEGRKVNPETP